MMVHNPEIFIRQHRNTQRILELRDRRGELSARVEALSSVEGASGNHTGFGTRMVVAVGEAMVSLGQRLKERGMAYLSTPVRVRWPGRNVIEGG